ncbi:NADH-quinone oxidoreductase subunit NuoE [bacterium]|nr:NADH-quinone oxidoreductase subunit NuoE [bacterium]
MSTKQLKMKKELKVFIDECMKKENPESYLIAVLHKAQNIYTYLQKDIMDEIAFEMSIPTAHIWGVATFYHYFNLKPIGKHVVSLCMGTACYVKGAGNILDVLKRELKVEVGETTEDNLFTLQEARCLGACGLAPVMMIDNKIYGELTPEKTLKIINEYRLRAK